VLIGIHLGELQPGATGEEDLIRHELSILSEDLAVAITVAKILACQRLTSEELVTLTRKSITTNDTKIHKGLPVLEFKTYVQRKIKRRYTAFILSFGGITRQVLLEEPPFANPGIKMHTISQLPRYPLYECQARSAA
jgi:hypothetical protein